MLSLVGAVILLAFGIIPILYFFGVIGFNLPDLAEYLHYSVAIGAFLAGISLASSSYKLEVASRVKVLRDFFATIFFVSLGMQLTIPNIDATLAAIIAFSFFVIVGKPIIILIIGRAVGFKKRVAGMAGLPLGQISEFSLIILALGISLGHISPALSSMMIIVAAVTITTTTYVVKYEQAFYYFMRDHLKLSGMDPRIQRKWSRKSPEELSRDWRLLVCKRKMPRKYLLRTHQWPRNSEDTLQGMQT